MYEIYVALSTSAFELTCAAKESTKFNILFEGQKDFVTVPLYSKGRLNLTFLEFSE